MEKWEQLLEELPLPQPGQKVLIWGAGNTSVLNHEGMIRENLYEELRVSAFLDSKLAGTEFNGFPVLHPDMLRSEDADAVFILISTTNNRAFCEIGNECRKLGIKSCLLDAVMVKLRKEEFKVSAKLFDAASRDIYNHLLEYRISCGGEYEKLYAGESYFGIPAFCRADGSDVIIDCGAYVGDSAERYIWRMDKFKKYIAIEPDYNNYSAMTKRFVRLREEWNIPEEKLIAFWGGTDEVSGRRNVESRVAGLGSVAADKADTGSDGVAFWALDDLFPEGFTFLKADIESYEYRMLHGARKTIQKYKPRMAICIYHSMIDMFSIPLLIHTIFPGYKLEVRHHSYGYEETVLYAY